MARFPTAVLCCPDFTARSVWLAMRLAALDFTEDLAGRIRKLLDVPREVVNVAIAEGVLVPSGAESRGRPFYKVSWEGKVPEGLGVPRSMPAPVLVPGLTYSEQRLVAVAQIPLTRMRQPGRDAYLLSKLASVPLAYTRQRIAHLVKIGCLAFKQVGRKRWYHFSEPPVGTEAPDLGASKSCPAPPPVAAPGAPAASAEAEVATALSIVQACVEVLGHLGSEAKALLSAAMEKASGVVPDFLRNALNAAASKVVKPLPDKGGKRATTDSLVAEFKAWAKGSTHIDDIEDRQERARIVAGWFAHLTARYDQKTLKISAANLENVAGVLEYLEAVDLYPAEGLTESRLKEMMLGRPAEFAMACIAATFTHSYSWDHEMYLFFKGEGPDSAFFTRAVAAYEKVLAGEPDRKIPKYQFTSVKAVVRDSGFSIFGRNHKGTFKAVLPKDDKPAPTPAEELPLLIFTDLEEAKADHVARRRGEKPVQRVRLDGMEMKRQFYAWASAWEEEFEKEKKAAAARREVK